ncbi:MAG: cation transporter [Candidatus Margulisbacteria bacterium GWF2_35_9]|nr:MAG: cation transporter [Candidatus Margulisbacteria bacterium GWF2_35_9]
MNTKIDSPEEKRAKQASYITWVGFFANLFLFAFKLFTGIVGHSSAMIADAIHSLSDFATDIVVLVSFRIVSKPPDKTHDYGHGKFETLATTIIGVVLFLVGFGIFYAAGKNIYSVLILKEHIHSPGIIALIAAVLSIIVKELLYRYSVFVGKQINSQAIIANAWHHRSDAFSSIGTLFGIGGAILLGEKWNILDPIAAVIVSIFIIKVACDITVGSLKELMEESIDEETENAILAIIKDTKHVIDPHNLRTRKNGNKMIVDVHIRVPNSLSIVEAHEVTNQIEKKLKEKYNNDLFINIHTEPENK